MKRDHPYAYYVGQTVILAKHFKSAEWNVECAKEKVRPIQSVPREKTDDGRKRIKPHGSSDGFETSQDSK